MASKSQLSSPSSQKLYGYQRDISSTVVSLSDLNGLLDVLVAVAGKWELFLIALGVFKGDIDQIKAERAQLPDGPKLCLLDGLDRWVKSSDLPTYGRIMEALHSNSFTNKRLAAPVYEFARQLCQKKAAVQPVKPVSAALPQPLSVDQPTSSGGTSCEPTSPPHQTFTTPDEPTENTAQPSIGLETKGLVDHQPFDKALAMHNKLKKSFSSQAAQLKHHLKAIYTDEKLSEFQYSFIQELPCSVRDEHRKFFRSNSSEISRATTFDELFILLDTYWDCLNYTLLEGIVDIHGTEEMQEDMESYVKDLEDFRRKTTLSVFLQLERHKIRRKAPPGFSQFVTKHCITRESTLEDIENLRLEITDEFQLRKFALLVINIVEGCVIITWFVPSSVISLLKEGLGKPEVLAKLHIDSVEFFDEVEQSDAPVDSDAELARLLEKYNQEEFDSGSVDSSGHEDSPNSEDSDSLSSPHSPDSPEAKHTPFSRDLIPFFHAAAESGDADTVRKLLKDGVDVNENRSGQTAVMLAARNGHVDIVSILMKSGADPNVRDPISKDTPLMAAARWGHTAIVRALGTGSVNINASNIGRQTALMLAAAHGHTDTVQKLAALGADIHIKDKAGQTALMSAARYGHTDTAQALAALGVDLHIQNADGRTALMWAAGVGHTDTVQALAALGTDIHIKDQGGRTALLWAAECGHTDTVQALGALGADIHILDQDGCTALMLAAKHGHTDTVWTLAVLGSNTHIQDSVGRTALMLAAGCGSTDTVQALATLKADIHIKDQNGQTALMWAAKLGHTDTVQALAAHGADICAEDGHGRTALMLAAEHHCTHTVQALARLTHIEDEKKKEAAQRVGRKEKGVTRPREELMKAKTAQHREHSQP